jgi:hypothetical protein
MRLRANTAWTTATSCPLPPSGPPCARATWPGSPATTRPAATSSVPKPRAITPLGAWQLVGRLDRVDRGADGQTLVIDYKTEGRQRTADRIKDAAEDTQLAFYAALLPDDSLRAAYLNVGERDGTKLYEQARRHRPARPPAGRHPERPATHRRWPCDARAGRRQRLRLVRRARPVPQGQLGRARHANRGGSDMSAAGPPQGAKAPLGGSDPHAVGESGGHMSKAAYEINGDPATREAFYAIACDPRAQRVGGGLRRCGQDLDAGVAHRCVRFWKAVRRTRSWPSLSPRRRRARCASVCWNGWSSLPSQTDAQLRQELTATPSLIARRNQPRQGATGQAPGATKSIPDQLLEGRAARCRSALSTAGLPHCWARRRWRCCNNKACPRTLSCSKTMPRPCARSGPRAQPSTRPGCTSSAWRG